MKAPSGSIWILTILLLQPVASLAGQDLAFRVVDFVDLPFELSVKDDSSCLLEFREQWKIDVKNLSLTKQANAGNFACGNDTLDLSSIKGPRKLSPVSYEFCFLDPHLESSGNQAFSGPESMNEAVRDFQDAFISLINKAHPIARIYNPREQLLSLYFHEEWTLNPAGNQIHKKVLGITPVIWQLRQTTAGEAINDAETGFPVYYKIKLEQIRLRTP